MHAPGQQSSLGGGRDLPGDVWRPAQRKRGPGGDPERRAGGARHRRRNRAGEQTGEEDRDLNEISKVSGTYL